MRVVVEIASKQDADALEAAAAAAGLHFREHRSLALTPAFASYEARYSLEHIPPYLRSDNAEPNRSRGSVQFDPPPSAPPC